MNVDSNNVIEELLNEIRRLNRDKATLTALVKEQLVELEELKKEG